MGVGAPTSFHPDSESEGIIGVVVKCAVLLGLSGRMGLLKLKGIEVFRCEQILARQHSNTVIAMWSPERTAHSTKHTMDSTQYPVHSAQTQCTLHGQAAHMGMI